MSIAVFMMNFRMKRIFIAMAAAVCCLSSCVEKSLQIGGNFIPVDKLYDFYTAEFPLEDIDLKMADSLSGFSSTRITVGAIRDDEFGLTTRSAALHLVPVFDKDSTFFIGKDPIFQRFHFAAGKDTISTDNEEQASIIQGFNVYELKKGISLDDFDCNAIIEHGSVPVNSRDIIYNGGDSLSFDFSEEFGKKYLTLKNEDLKNFDKFLEKFPGIYIEADKPMKKGGRINLFKLQLNYNSTYGRVDGNYATLNYSAIFDGVRKDTSLRFWFGASDFYNVDSLLKNSGTGKFPEFCLNLTGQDTRSKAGKAKERIPVEGGGGIKPVISAKVLKEIVEKEIASKGGDPSAAVINKASLIFPFEFPEDYKEMRLWPFRLAPTCKIKTDTTAAYMGLTDSSSSSENQGDINRSTLEYAPDITYHMQEILKIDPAKKEDIKTKYLESGSYDIWLTIMANEKVTTSNNQNSEMNEYYQYLAYQSYYNSMYGGSGMGYGGYGNDYYSNYYTYMMMAQYASGTGSTTTNSIVLDKDRFYRASLNGPESKGRVPMMKVVYGIPKKQ